MDGELMQLDARGKACPIPVIELAKAVRDLDVGDHVLLLADDPAARTDVAVWCRMQRHRLHSAEVDDEGGWRFDVERRR